MKPSETVWPDGKNFILIYHSGHNTMIYIERADLSCVSNSIESNFIDSFFIVKSKFHFLSKYYLILQIISTHVTKTVLVNIKYQDCISLVLYYTDLYIYIGEEKVNK